MNKEEELRGLGGWLIFPIGGLFLGIYTMTFDLIDILNGYYEFNSLLIFSSILELMLLALSLIALISIFNKKRYVPFLMIILYILSMLSNVILSLFSEDKSIYAPYILSGVVWMIYFINSERVKKTFIE